jgi:hypothetical protein
VKLGVGLGEEEQDEGDDGEHTESGFLAVPHFGLSHEEPLGADEKEGGEPHEETQGERSHGDILGTMKVGRGRAERTRQTHTTPPA